MTISFTDITCLAATMGDDQQLLVDGEGKLSLGGHKVTLAKGDSRHILTKAEFLEALTRQTSETFVKGLNPDLVAGTKLTGRQIKNIVAGSKTEIATEAQLKNLTEGLRAKSVAPLAANSVKETIDKMLTTKAYTDVLAPVFADAFGATALSKLNAAIAAHAAAKAKAENLTGAALIAGNPPEGAAAAEALAAAEGDLAAALRAFTNRARVVLGRNLPDNVDTLLASLDGSAEAAEYDAIKLESAVSALGALAEDEKAAAETQLDQLLGKIDAPKANDATLAAIETFKKAARPFLKALARLDTAASDTTDRGKVKILGDIGTTYAQAAAALATLKDTVGLDPEAVKTLEANLVALKAHYDTVAQSAEETLVMDMLRELRTMTNTAGQLASSKLKNPKTHKAWRPFMTKINTLIDCNNKLARAVKALADGTAARDAVRDADSPLNEALGGVAEFVRDNSVLAGTFGLADFVSRYSLLCEAVRDGRFVSPYRMLDARRLGEVIRGEIDLMNYLGLLSRGFTEEMYRADLNGGAAVSKRHAGAGNFNSVDIYSIPNLRTGTNDEYVVKNIELSADASATGGVAAKFSDPRHGRNAAKLNYASWKGAHLIGCGDAITSSGVVRIGNRYQLVQEVAPGRDMGTITGHLRTGFVNELAQPDKTPALRARIKRELQIAAAKLEWADWLSGQLDRTIQNEMLNVAWDTDPKTGRVRMNLTLKGIDNDAAFPERRNGIYDFENSRGHKIISKANHGSDEMFDIIDNYWVRGLRKPIFLPKSVQEKLAKIDVDDYAAQMKPYLSGAALASAVKRLAEMKEAASTWNPAYVIDDTVSTNAMTDEQVLADADRLEGLYKTEYAKLSALIDPQNLDVAGGFYGYFMHLIPSPPPPVVVT